MAKGVRLFPKDNTRKKNNLFMGEHKVVQPIREHLTASPDNTNMELMRLKLIQEELERRMSRYEKTIDFYQYSLVLIVVLLMIKLIIDGKK